MAKDCDYATDCYHLAQKHLQNNHGPVPAAPGGRGRKRGKYNYENCRYCTKNPIRENEALNREQMKKK